MDFLGVLPGIYGISRIPTFIRTYMGYIWAINLTHWDSCEHPSGRHDSTWWSMEIFGSISQMWEVRQDCMNFLGAQSGHLILRHFYLLANCHQNLILMGLLSTWWHSYGTDPHYSPDWSSHGRISTLHRRSQELQQDQRPCWKRPGGNRAVD